MLQQIPVDDTETPGMGGAVSSVVGGVVGMTAVSLLFPGVGPVVVAGMIAGGVAGAATGLGIGQQVERHLSTGLTRDEVDVYGGALRAGKAVVIAGAETAGEVDAIRDTMRAAGAERVDPARAGGLADLLEPPGTPSSESARTSSLGSSRR